MAQKISNALLSGIAGFASFVFSLTAFLYITELDAQIVASIVAGFFCLLISYIASERPNSESSRALAALGERLLAVDRVLLLITGHERRGEPPVQRGQIRAAVHDWLASSRHSAHIAAVRAAHRRHGGGRSLYIILRRS